jgi:HEPN domain-containing protein
MPSRKEFQDLSRLRLKEAKVLYENGFYDGAWYLIGYVVELALKARICRILDRDYPDHGDMSRVFKTHKHDDLIILAGLEKKFDDACQNNLTLKSNWSTVTEWSEDFRYKPVGTGEKEKVQAAIVALQGKTSGVLTWLKKHW